MEAVLQKSGHRLLLTHSFYLRRHEQSDDSSFRYHSLGWHITAQSLLTLSLYYTMSDNLN